MNKPIRYSKRIRGENPEYGLYTNQCSVCLENKQNDIFYDNAYCDHNICMGCQYRWSETSIKCPTCQKSLVIIEPVIFEDYDDKLYPPFYFHRFDPPPIWVSYILIFLFKCFNKVLWYRDEWYRDDKEEEMMNQLDRLHRIQTALE